MTDKPSHPAESMAQVGAEPVILEAVARRAARGGQPITWQAKEIDVGVLADKPSVDGVSLDPPQLVEVYAHIGPLKGAHRHKIATDALKLAFIKQTSRDLADAELVLAFADEEARDGVRGWLRQAVESFGIQMLVFPLSENLRREVQAAQRAQGESGAWVPKERRVQPAVDDDDGTDPAD